MIVKGEQCDVQEMQAYYLATPELPLFTDYTLDRRGTPLPAPIPKNVCRNSILSTLATHTVYSPPNMFLG